MSGQSRLIRVVGAATFIFTALTALYLLIGGGWLFALGGSAYYVVTGGVLLGVTWFLYSRSSKALALYAVVLIGTEIWAFGESGPDFWALAPRAGVLVALGVWLLIVGRLLGCLNKIGGYALGGALAIWFGGLVYACFNDPQTINGSFSTAAGNPSAVNRDGINPADWPAYGHTQEGTRYSPQRQITPDNVKTLQVAWTYRTGDKKGPNDPIEVTDEVTPIKIGKLLYLCSPHQKLFALDAQTGELKWTFDPKLRADPSFQHVTCRGVSYVDLSPNSAEVAHAECARRIYLPVNNGHLYALDAQTGERCADFGANGDLDLQHAMPVETAGMYEPTSPPIVTNKVIIIGGGGRGQLLYT